MRDGGGFISCANRSHFLPHFFLSPLQTPKRARAFLLIPLLDDATRRGAELARIACTVSCERQRSVFQIQGWRHRRLVAGLSENWGFRKHALSASDFPDVD